MALIGGMALSIALTPALTLTVLAAEPIVIVQPGDTLTAIARRHGVSVARLAELNHLADPSRIFAGQRLRVAGGGSRASDQRAPSAQHKTIHVVARGSTLWGIARHYGVSVSSIATANQIANPSRIFVGQRLVIPGVKASTSGNSQRAKMSSRMAALVAERDSIRRMIVREADRRGVPRRLALAVAWQESGWQQGVVSHAGAVGVMQLMPATAEWVGQTMLGHQVRIHDARSNIAAGVRLLSHYLHRYGGNRDLVLAAYYQGQHAVDRYGIYPVSRAYIASVRYLERLFGG